MFALPWYLTWFGHSLNRYKDVVRLYDYFLASPPEMPLYVATALVVQRRNNIFAVDCDMASVHCLLSQIPDNLDFEDILENAATHFKKYPPDALEHLVKKRMQNEYVIFGLFLYMHKALHFVKQLFSVRFYFALLYSLIYGRPKHKY